MTPIELNSEQQRHQDSNESRERAEREHDASLRPWHAWEDGTDCIIGETLDEALAVWSKQAGLIQPEVDGKEFEPCLDSTEVTINDPDLGPITQTYRKQIDDHIRQARIRNQEPMRLLWSTEY